MIIKPVVRGFICTTAHPEGCAAAVRSQINHVRSQKPVQGPKNVLVIGASTGYGLASRIVTAFGAGAKTVGVFFERPAADKRTASAGWYNTAAFENEAAKAGLKAWSVNGDAFSDAVKNDTIQLIKRELGTVDLVVYSLASPRRTNPRTGETFSSALKPVGKPFISKAINLSNNAITTVNMEPASEEEIKNTVAVMGGEDWIFWMEALLKAGVLAPGALTVAYSYIGPAVTAEIYREGTIGKAKDHIENTVTQINTLLKPVNGRALISVNKAIVTQASAAIPVVPLYISILFKVMKEKNLHEGAIEQIQRLFAERLYNGGNTAVDEKGRVRIDDWEMREDVQKAVAETWPRVTTENLNSLSDIDSYHGDFLKLFGFGWPGVNVEADVEADVPIPSLRNDSVTA